MHGRLTEKRFTSELTPWPRSDIDPTSTSMEKWPKASWPIADQSRTKRWMTSMSVVCSPNAFVEHVQNKHMESMHIPDLGDPTPTQPRSWKSFHVLPTFGPRPYAHDVISEGRPHLEVKRRLFTGQSCAPRVQICAFHCFVTVFPLRWPLDDVNA